MKHGLSGGTEIAVWFTRLLFQDFRPLNLGEVPWWLSGEESDCNAGNAGLNPGLGRSPGEGNGNPFQYSCLGNPKDEEPGGLQSVGSQRVKHN